MSGFKGTFKAGGVVPGPTIIVLPAGTVIHPTNAEPKAER